MILIIFYIYFYYLGLYTLDQGRRGEARGGRGRRAAGAAGAFADVSSRLEGAGRCGGQGEGSGGCVSEERALLVDGHVVRRKDAPWPRERRRRARTEQEGRCVSRREGRGSV